MGNIDILSLLDELEEEENEEIINRLKVRLSSGRVIPLRKVYDTKEKSKLVVNLHIDMAVRSSLPETGELTGDNYLDSVIEELDFTEEHLVDLTGPERKSISSSAKIPEGDKLPHQKDDLRPDGIVEHEQEPPEILITENDKVYVSADILEELIAREKDEDDIFYSPSPHAEKHHDQWHREMKKKIGRKK